MLGNPNHEKHGLRLTSKIIESTKNTEAVEKLVKKLLGQILRIRCGVKSENITKNMAASVLEKLVKLFDSEHCIKELPKNLSLFVCNNFTDNYKPIYNEVLKPMSMLSPSLISEVSPSLVASINNLKQRRPQLGNQAQILYQDILES